MISYPGFWNDPGDGLQNCECVLLATKSKFDVVRLKKNVLGDESACCSKPAADWGDPLPCIRLIILLKYKVYRQTRSFAVMISTG